MSVTLMDIEHKDIPKLMKEFKKHFQNYMHIKFIKTKTLAQVGENKTAVVDIINVQINDTSKGGRGEENWTLQYAYDILKHPKEMDLCVQRWLLGFKTAKKKPTLDLPGYTSPTIN